MYPSHLSRYKYCFVIYSPQDKKIIDVVDSRHLNNLIDYILQIYKEFKLAYELLHEYRNLNDSAIILNTAEWPDELILKFQNSMIPKYIPTWKLLKNWSNEILNSIHICNVG